MLLRRCHDHRHGRSGRRRLLPLQVLSELVRRPVNAFTLWKPEAVEVTKGQDQIGEYHNNERSYRQWCTACGGHLMTRHPQWGLVDVYAATIPDFPFAPGVHVNYESTVLPMKDGLPKLKDFPEALGGSGETIAE